MSVYEAKFGCSAPARRQIRVAGQVQGVGFRPFVYRLAQELNLGGFIRNDGAGVIIEVQGEEADLVRFEEGIQTRRPALAVIRSFESKSVPLRATESGFLIESSEAGSAAMADVTVDTAVCPGCLAELLGDTDRRHGYGLINCTNCGPRYSIIQGIPYDRPNTTMAAFAMCSDCRREYADPGDRRFHAQPVACHKCGPKLELVDGAGKRFEGDPIHLAAGMLLAGKILAIKGLGGFHLAVRADDQAAVGRLRELKLRDAKPFALMCRSINEVRGLVELSTAAEAAMRSSACPIVLAKRRGGVRMADAVAPGNHRLGVMLPYTPIQHLLFAAEPRLPALVMTSANVSDEPLVIDNAEALRRLGGMCDALLWHDRPIERAVDDSVLLDAGDGLLPVRRARGYVPAGIECMFGVPRAGGTPNMGLCVGGELKNTIAVVRGGHAILSHHLGDLTHVENYACFRRAIDDMQKLFSVRPQWVAHDLHPMYLSTKVAQELGRQLDVPLIGVQHHHAHAAALLAEHGVTEKALVVVCDGVGYGTDDTMWGGELLAADLAGFERLARLRPLLLPGGDAAARDTRRSGLALLHQAFGDVFANHPAAAMLVPDEEERSILTGMMRGNIRCVRSSGVGRVFDGMAALLGVCQRNSFEAEAGMKLESLAADLPERTEDELFDIHGDELMTIDLGELIRVVVESKRSPAVLSALFHDQLAWAWECAVSRAAGKHGYLTVGLTGGVFCNQRLTAVLTRRLERRGLRVLRHRVVPANDGGISFGQAAVALSTGGVLCA